MRKENERQKGISLINAYLFLFLLCSQKFVALKEKK